MVPPLFHRSISIRHHYITAAHALSHSSSGMLAPATPTIRMRNLFHWSVFYRRRGNRTCRPSMAAANSISIASRYETCVFQALREQLRCRAAYVDGPIVFAIPKMTCRKILTRRKTTTTLHCSNHRMQNICESTSTADGGCTPHARQRFQR